jgi:hypothetical protein
MSARIQGGLTVFAAALLIGASAGPVGAQVVQDTAVTTTTTYQEEEREGGFPWGLLGLLGLAGLLGRGKKHEVHHETVRPVETHRATPNTTTGTVTDRTVIRPDETGGTHGGTTGGGTRL